VGGCGRFFEGTAAQMHANLTARLAALPDHTLAFCAHAHRPAAAPPWDTNRRPGSVGVFGQSQRRSVDEQRVRCPKSTVEVGVGILGSSYPSFHYLG